MKEEKSWKENKRQAREGQKQKERKKLKQEKRQNEKEVQQIRNQRKLRSKYIENNGQCFSCGMVFSPEDDKDRFWVFCDRCDKWQCFACHKLLIKDSVPDELYCMTCM